MNCCVTFFTWRLPGHTLRAVVVNYDPPNTNTVSAKPNNASTVLIGGSVISFAKASYYFGYPIKSEIAPIFFELIPFPNQFDTPGTLK
jgi:hypothetical protein